MRAECHGELSETCRGFLPHLALPPKDEQGEAGGFTAQQRGHISCNIVACMLTLPFSLLVSLYICCIGFYGLECLV